MLYLGLLVLAFLVSLISTYVVYAIAIRKSWVSKPDFRRKNSRPVALLGGLAVYFTICLTSWLGNVPEVFNSLLVTFPIILFGVCDDIWELRARTKFLGQFIALACWVWVTPTATLILSKTGMPDTVAWALTLFWVLGVMNATNMIDGMDGEASIFAIISAIALAFITPSSHQSMFLGIVACSYMGFLVHNFYPARIYLGDSGSHLIGMLLGTMSATISTQTLDVWQVLLPLFVFAFPEIDAIFAISRRLKAASSPLKGDHDHIHHKLLKIGLSVRQAWFVIFLAICYSGATAVGLALLKDNSAQFVVAFSCISALLMILSAVFFVEHILAKKVSSFSRGIIFRYFKIDDALEVDDEHFRATVYDLWPYYQELQTRGITEIHGFIQDLHQFIEKNHAQGKQILLVGSYSILVYEEGMELSRDFKMKVIKLFFELLQKRDLKKNDTDIPWGLKFVTEKNFEDFARKYNVSTKGQRNPKYTAA